MHAFMSRDHMMTSFDQLMKIDGNKYYVMTMLNTTCMSTKIHKMT